MDWASLQGWIQTGSVILTMIVALGTIRGRNNESVETLATIKADISHIKQKVDSLDGTEVSIADLQGRVKRLERRVDKLEQYHVKA